MPEWSLVFHRLLVAFQDVPVVPCWCWEGEEEQIFLGLSVEMDRHSGVVMPPLLQQGSVCAAQGAPCCPSSAYLRRETDSSYLSVHLFHLKYRTEQLWSRQPKAWERKEERDTKRSVTLKEKLESTWLGITVSQRKRLQSLRRAVVEGCSTAAFLLCCLFFLAAAVLKVSE